MNPEDIHEGLVITPFKEWMGTYEFEKAEAFRKHLQTLLRLTERAQKVSICPKAPERPWISVQEWTEGASGNRHGQWQSDLEIEHLA